MRHLGATLSTGRSSDDSWSVGLVCRPCFLVLSPDVPPAAQPSAPVTFTQSPLMPHSPYKQGVGSGVSAGIARGWARAVVLESETMCMATSAATMRLLVPRRIRYLKHTKGANWSQCQTWGTGAFFADQ